MSDNGSDVNNNRQSVEDSPAHPSISATARKKANGATRVVGGIRKNITTVDKLNKKYALLCVPGNSSCIIDRETSTLVSDEDMRRRLANYIVVAFTKKATIAIPAYKAWIENSERETCRRMIFTSGNVPAYSYNLFSGFGVAPKKGKCKFILKHILEVIASGDRFIARTLLDLIAWQLQNVGKPSRIIPTLISETQQTGKGTLLEGILLPIWGRAGHRTENIETIVGRFNSSALRGKGFVFLDEALYSGNISAASKIKGLAATRSAPIDEKYLPVIQMPVGINFWIASNSKYPVHVEERDARYWSIIVSDHAAKERAYFAKLYDEIENDGLSHFLYAMLRRDISKFDPQINVPIDNDAHSEMCEASRNAGDPRNWMDECIAAQELLHVPAPHGSKHTPWIHGERVKSSDMLQGYKIWVQNIRSYGIKTFNPKDFWKIVSSYGFEVVSTKQGNFRQFPAIPDS